MVILRYADEKIAKSIEKLELRDKDLHRHIMNALRNIMEDPVCGIKISQKLIPKNWKKKYLINNLYKYSLPDAWRLIYSLSGNRAELIAIILGGFSHKEYEKIFKY